MSNAPQAETTTVVQIMNDEGNEDVCMCVCVFVTRRKEEKKTREKDAQGRF
jgi:mRNA-degrading endonuclease toxin of MazEF toxin-antitoxin module